jgi:hypothetical protein
LISPKWHKFHEDVSFAFFVQITVVWNIESLSNVIKFHTSVYVDLSISFFNDFYSFCVTVSSEMIKESRVINLTTIIGIKFWEELLTFFFWNLKSKVNETPSEIIDVQIMTTVIHSCKNFTKVSKSNPWSSGNSSFEIFTNFVGVNFCEFFNLSSILSIWRSV